MRFCLQAGIRHDEFLSWPETERAKVLAKILHDGELHSCGTRTADWYDEDGRLKEPAPWEVEIRECQGCAVIAAARKDLSKSESSDRYHLGWSKAK